MIEKQLQKLVLIIIMTAVLQGTAYADPLSDQLQSQKEKLKQSQSLLNSAKLRSDQLEQQIEMVDNQIEDIMRKIDDNKKQIIKVQQDIDVSDNQIKEAQKKLDEESELFASRMRAMYINGTSSYIIILLGSKDLDDFISRAAMIEKMIEFDRKITSDLKIKQKEISERKKKLSSQKVKLISLKGDNEKKLISLNKDKLSQKQLIEKSQKEERLYAANLNDSQSAVNTTLRQIYAIRKAAPRISVSRGAAPISDNSIIAYASNFLGTPYVWGGTTPNPGFDCSGFTQYVYRHFGISIGRTTYEQINDGVQVPRDQLQAGDLVFFGSWSDPHHVGIYVGNGMYIHAPHTGDVIKISPIGRTDYLTARRVK